MICNLVCRNLESLSVINLIDIHDKVPRAVASNSISAESRLFALIIGQFVGSRDTVICRQSKKDEAEALSCLSTLSDWICTSEGLI